MNIKVNNPEDAKKFFENKLSYTIGPVEVAQYRKQGASDFNIIDVRDAKDFVEEHVPGALSLPEDQWDSLKGLSKDKPNVLYCYSQNCHLAANAAVRFASKGFPVIEMDGGFADYKKQNLEIEKGQRAA